MYSFRRTVFLLSLSEHLLRIVSVMHSYGLFLALALWLLWNDTVLVLRQCCARIAVALPSYDIRIAFVFVLRSFCMHIVHVWCYYCVILEVGLSSPCIIIVLLMYSDCGSLTFVSY